ncbi:MAG: DUF3488 domain-containing protein [Zoogloea sp.]|nr:DUF3488 domain-containing protein [Zoogloea sp.]
MTPKPPLRPDQTGWLLACATLSLAPHASHLPLSLIGVCGLLLGWRVVLLNQGNRLPHRVLLFALAVSLVALVAVEFQRLFGKEPGIALLAGLLIIKLLETHDVRDARTVILLSFFMQMGLFLYQQTMGVAALALAGSVSTVAALLSLEGRAEPPRARGMAAARLVLQGLPLMLVLFVLFPRIQGPLWGLPADAYTHRTGLSDSMSPGDVARISESGAIAFRARFEGDPPPPAERYWRGPVLSEFDGRTWRQTRGSVTEAPSYRSQGTAYTYTLTLEPHNHRWLLALDFPAAAPGLRYSSDFQLLAQAPVHTRIRVDLVSHPGTQVGLDESDAVLRQALYLPPESNPRTRALGTRLRAEARTSGEIPALVIAHFQAIKLAYTLDPLPLGRDDVDSFLFETRQGFCEALRCRLRRHPACRRRPRAGRHGLPGWRNQRCGRHLRRAPVRCPCLGRDLARRKGLAAHRSNRSQRSAAYRQRPRGRTARYRPPAPAGAQRPALAAHPARQSGGHRQPLESMGSRVQSGPPAGAAFRAGPGPNRLDDTHSPPGSSGGRRSRCAGRLGPASALASGWH